MILATVGTQLPYPRLIRALDRLATEIDEPIIAQTGPDPRPYPNLDLSLYLTPSAFRALVSEARLIVAHAGVGTILTARDFGKPLVLLPRRHAEGEHRNDHQMATAREVARHPGIHVAWEASDLARLLTRRDLSLPGPGGTSRPQLVRRIREFIDG